MKFNWFVPHRSVIWVVGVVVRETSFFMSVITLCNGHTIVLAENTSHRIPLLFFLFLWRAWFFIDFSGKFLQFQFEDGDVFSALCDAVFERFLLLLALLHLGTISCWVRPLVSYLGQLVAKLFLGLHHFLKSEENRSWLVEEVVFYIKSLILLSKNFASSVKFINCTLHLWPFKLWERDVGNIVIVPIFSQGIVSSFCLLALQFKDFVLKQVVFFEQLFHFRPLFCCLCVQPGVFVGKSFFSDFHFLYLFP